MALSPTYLFSLGSNQGLRGQSILPAYYGAPTVNFTSNDGDIALDTTNRVLYAARSAGQWATSGVSVAGPVGPQGVPGVSSVGLSNQQPMYHETVGFPAQTALSSTPLTMPFVGAPACVPYFYPTWNSTLLYLLIVVYTGNSTASNVTFTLRDANTGGQWYTSGSYSYGTVASESPNASVPAGGAYYWQVTGSGGSPITILPVYSSPATLGSGAVVSTMPVCGIYNSATLSSTPTVCKWPSSSTSTAYIRPYQNCYVYEATFTNTSSANIGFQMYNSTAGAAIGPTYTVAAGSETRTGVLAPGTIKLPAGYNVFWRVTGSTSQNCNIQWSVAT